MSRLENPKLEELNEHDINNKFPDEHLLKLSNEENEISEEMLLKNEIENIDFKSLLKAKAKLSYENNKNAKNDKKLNKNKIKTEIEKINN